MDPFQALVLGIVQGLAEFLPISSAGHLILAPWLLGWNDPGLTFDVALHVGTLLAVLAYFRRDWLDILGGLLSSIRNHALADNPQARLFWLLALASAPGAIIGALLESAVESWLRAPLIVAVLMIAMAVLLLIAEAVGNRSRTMKSLNVADALLIGLSQAIAVCPGVSRSGSTIAVGLLRGLTRRTAARFSFLMGTPIVGGAALLNGRRLLMEGVPADDRLAFLVGIVTSAVVGFLVIGLLLAYLKRHSLRVFAYYRFAFGLLVILLVLLGARE